MWGHYYGANLGDELVTGVVVDAVRRRQPLREIVAFSLDPSDSGRRHNVAGAYGITPQPVHPSGRSGQATRGPGRILSGLRRRGATLLHEPAHLWRSYRVLRGVDQLVIAGSGQLLDSWSGPWGHPYAILKWTALARLAHTETLFLSVGAGPLDRWLSRRMVRAAVERARYVSVRDRSSARELRDAGVTRTLPVVPDMAFAITSEASGFAPVSGADEAEEGRRRPRVGLNAMAHFNARYWGRGDQKRYREYVRKMATLIEAIVNGGAEVTLFTSQVRADPATAADVMAEVDRGGVETRDHVQWQPVEGVEDLLHVISECDEVIASRYHCVLLPLLMGIPTIGLAYHPKTSDLMELLGQQESCFSIESFDPHCTVERLHQLRDEGVTVRQTLAARIPPLRSAVEEQFDRVFPAQGGAPREAHPS